jgi:hypothetical protein
MTTKVHLRDEVNAAAMGLARTLSDVLEDNPQGTSYLTDRDGLLVHTQLQVVFNMRFATKLEQVLHELMVTHSTAAERSGPGAFDVSLRAIVGSLLHPDVLPHLAPPGAERRASRATEADLAWLVERYCVRRPQLFQEALRLAGFRGRVVVEKTIGVRAGLEVVKGHVFEVRCALDLPALRLKEPRIACIDGYVESVGELHGFLEEAAEAKQPALLFVRGLADDVLHTLKVNYDRGSLKVVPLIVRYDLAGVNTLADVCASTGGDLVSTHRGDVISSCKFSQSPAIDEAIVYRDKVVLLGSKAPLTSHVQELCRRRDEAMDPTVTGLYEDRLRSLCPSYVMIRLPDDHGYVADAQSIDHGLRAYSRMLSHGIVDTGRGRELAVTWFAASVQAQRCIETIRDLGAAIVT